MDVSDRQIGLSGYRGVGLYGNLFYAFDIGASNWDIVGAGLFLLLIMTYLVSGGISRSNRANKYIVTTTIIGLFSLVVTGLFINGVPMRLLIFQRHLFYMLLP